MGRQGRVVIPAGLRRSLDLHEGDDLLASLENGRLVLRRDEETDERLWAMFRDDRGSMTEELLRERRAEAAREKRD
ncbi:MAG: AbrB/MazE/SpoVT family DNA-binding domain-containing protein [Myxococcaceae bacterium]